MDPFQWYRICFFEQLIPKVVGLILCCAETCDFGILKSGQTGQTFSLFFVFFWIDLKVA